MNENVMDVKINMLLAARRMTLQDLANNLIPPTKPSNISGKLKRNNFSEKEIREIAKACNARYEIRFILDDTGQKF